MKKLLLLLLCLPLFAMAQLTPAQDTTLILGSTAFTPQFRFKNVTLDGVSYRIPQAYNSLLGKYDTYITSKYLRAFYAPITGGSYVPLTRLVSTGVGLLGGGNLGSNLTLTVDTANITSKTYFNTRIGTPTAAAIATKQNTITFGTGVQTALGVNIGSAGAPVLFNGAGGTPSSMVGTNITGTAAALSIGGNAATATLATNSTLWNNVAINLSSPTTTIDDAAVFYNGVLRYAAKATYKSWLDLGSYAYRSSGLAELSGATYSGGVEVPSIKITSGASNGYVLKSDASGNASWQPTTSSYKGTWDASTNTPTIADGTGALGDYYGISTGGTQFGRTFVAGGTAVYNGSIWEPLGAAASVTAVNGFTGSPVINPTLSGDIIGTTGGSSTIDISTATSVANKIPLTGGNATGVINQAGNQNSSFFQGIRNTNSGSSALAGVLLGNDLTANGGGIVHTSSNFTGIPDATYIFGAQTGGLILNTESTADLKLQVNGSTKLTASTTGVNIPDLITTTQSANDNSTKGASTAYVDALKGANNTWTGTNTFEDQTTFWDGIDSGEGLVIRPWTDGGLGAIYSTAITPDDTNYSFRTSGSTTDVNATNTVQLRVNGATIAEATSTGVEVTGTLSTSGLDNYTSDLSGSYTSRSKVDKEYVDNAVATFTSGTYTPTITNGTNVSSNTPAVCNYIRVGNMVTVSGYCGIQASSANITGDLLVSLPIASNMSQPYELTGLGSGTGGGDISRITILPSAGDEARIAFLAGAGTSSQTIFFTFTYQVI